MSDDEDEIPTIEVEIEVINCGSDDEDDEQDTTLVYLIIEANGDSLELDVMDQILIQNTVSQASLQGTTQFAAVIPVPEDEDE